MTRNTHKLLAVLLSVIMVFSILPVIPFTAFAETVSGTCGENLTWQYDTETATLTISGTGAMSNYYGDYYSSNYVTSAPWRSYYQSMKTVVINNGVTSIGESAFSGCTGLTSITIPDSVTSIGYRAFYYCAGLTSITIPDSVTSISGNAFSGCTGLTSITIPDSVTSIGRDAFYNTAWYNNQPDGLVYAGKVAYTYKGICPANVTIKEGTLVINACAFQYTAFTSITIPDSVTSIGNYAFSYCAGLTSVTIGNGVTSIGNDVFSGCTGLTSITIPDSVTSIGGNAFYDCTGLTSVTIGNSVTSIDYGAFSGCTGLTSVTIGNSVTSISGNAFSGCTGLKTAGPIGGGYNIEFCWSDTIPEYAFSPFKYLTEVTLPDSITEIEKYAFENCRELTDVYYAGSEKDKKNIIIDNRHTGNDDLLYANWHYNCAINTENCRHSNTKWITVEKPTLAKTGLKKEVCAICGKELGSAEIPVIDLAAPRIELQCGSAVIGTTTSVKIQFKNNPGITSVKIRLFYDDDLTLESIAYNEEIGGISQQPYTLNSPITLNWINGLQNQNGDFLFATLNFKVANDAQPGIKKITVYYDSEDIFNIDDTNIDFAIIDGETAVIHYLPGDINGDEVCNNKDLTRLFQYLSDWPVEVNEATLDVNGDGKINNKDLTRLFQYLSDWDVEIF